MLWANGRVHFCTAKKQQRNVPHRVHKMYIRKFTYRSGTFCAACLQALDFFFNLSLICRKYGIFQVFYVNIQHPDVTLVWPLTTVV